MDATCHKYLGALVSIIKALYDFLIEKVTSRLIAWKRRLLTPVGRMVLIKSVLQLFPIYHMSTSKVSTQSTTKIEKIYYYLLLGESTRGEIYGIHLMGAEVSPNGHGRLGFKDKQ